MEVSKENNYKNIKLNIVLVEPEIPQNTGNIARTCAATGANLHLIKPLGFLISDKYLKRAGLDYWDKLNVIYHENLNSFLESTPINNMYFSTTKAEKCYSEMEFPNECYILFGKETKGLPEDLLFKYYNHCFRIPMKDSIRSLNLSNAVSIITYEYFRQKDFNGFIQKGNLTNI